jgi:endonuclease YncB( thermonuclease family)
MIARLWKLLFLLACLAGSLTGFALPTAASLDGSHRRHSHKQNRRVLSISRGGQQQQHMLDEIQRSTTALYAKSKAAATTIWQSPMVTKLWALLVAFAVTIQAELKALTKNQTLLFVAVFLVGLKFGRSAPITKRYSNAVDVPSAYFGPKAPKISGRCVSVSDGDTLRFLHTPTPFHSSTIKKGQKMSAIAMPIRICTIDTPETPKFGKPGQKFGLEAKEELKTLVDGKKIQIRLLQTDQYGRAVAQVFVPRVLSFWRRHKCVDEHMLQQGLAEVYTGMGAVYGPLGKEKYVELAEQAQTAKRGIWSQTNRESAAEYKKRTK